VDAGDNEEKASSQKSESEKSDQEVKNEKKVVEAGMNNFTQISLMKLKETMIKHSMLLAELKKRDEANFFCHGKKLSFAKDSLFLFSDSN
jgi:hypothetical protein